MRWRTLRTKSILLRIKDPRTHNSILFTIYSHSNKITPNTLTSNQLPTSRQIPRIKFRWNWKKKFKEQHLASIWLTHHLSKDHSITTPKTWTTKKKQKKKTRRNYISTQNYAIAITKEKQNEGIPSIINFPQDEGNCKLSSRLVICCNISRVPSSFCRSPFVSYVSRFFSSYFQSAPILLVEKILL